MATYAAFKHVELYNVGKAKKRVLRAPGGGSSDIFGSDMPQTPRNVKNRMASNIFSAEKDAAQKNNVRQGAHRFYFIGDAPRRGQKPVDSFSRLFGEPARPITPGNNHMKSSIAFGQNTNGAQPLLNNNKGKYNGKSGSVSSASSSVSSSTENLKINNVGNRSEGNPVTGEGYKAGGNDYIQAAPAMNGGNQIINKNRVPPGGYSSGLW